MAIQVLIPRDESCKTNIYTSASLSRAEREEKTVIQAYWKPTLYFSIPVFTHLNTSYNYFLIKRTKIHMQFNLSYSLRSNTTRFLYTANYLNSFLILWYRLFHSVFIWYSLNIHLIVVLSFSMQFVARSQPRSYVIIRIINLIISFQSKAHVVVGYFHLSIFLFLSVVSTSQDNSSMVISTLLWK